MITVPHLKHYDLFDACFVLNVPCSTIRLENFKNHLNNFDFGQIQVFSPVKVVDYPTDWVRGGWSNLLSFITILVDSVYLGHKKILIMEDDYQCGSDFSNLILEHMIHLPPDWHVANFHCCGRMENPIKINDYWTKCDKHVGTQCIAFNLPELFKPESPFFLMLMHPNYWERTENAKVFVMDRGYTKYARTVGLNWYVANKPIGSLLKCPSDLFNESGVLTK